MRNRCIHIYSTTIHSFTGSTYSGSRTCSGPSSVHIWESRWDQGNVRDPTFFTLMWVLFPWITLRHFLTWKVESLGGPVTSEHTMDFPPWQQQLMPEGRWILNVNFHRVFKLQGIELESLGLGITEECTSLEKCYFDVQTKVVVELKTKVSFVSRARDWTGMQQQGWCKAKVSGRFETAEWFDRIKAGIIKYWQAGQHSHALLEPYSRLR